VRNDETRRKQLMDQIRAYRETLFSREHQQTVLTPLIDQMQALVTGFGVPNAVAEINSVRQQLRLAESAGYIAAGLPDPANPVYILKHDTSACLHASNTESIPPGIPAPANFEVYHQPLKVDNDKTDLWVFNDLGTGKSLTNQAYNRVLHASATQVTAQGHKYHYTCAPNNVDHAQKSSRLFRCPSPSPIPLICLAGSHIPAISTSSACGQVRWRSTGWTSHPRAGPGCTRSSLAPTSTFTDQRIV
jgi:hypothetical protein